jgi:hypothetical protein
MVAQVDAERAYAGFAAFRIGEIPTAMKVVRKSVAYS